VEPGGTEEDGAIPGFHRGQDQPQARTGAVATNPTRLMSISPRVSTKSRPRRWSM
jgi:hypothetical protein